MRDGLERYEQAIVVKSLDIYLVHEPTRRTRNRKPRHQPCPFGATWALRLGNLRVYYDVIEEDLERVVIAVAVGKKLRERCRAGLTLTRQQMRERLGLTEAEIQAAPLPE